MNRREAAEADEQFIAGEEDLEAAGSGRAEPQIDIIPEYGGVAARLGHRARHALGMGVALRDFAPGAQRDIIQRVR